MQSRGGTHYWIEDEHLLCQPVGSQQVWGVSLEALRCQRKAQGHPRGIRAVVRPIGAKRKREQRSPDKKGKEKVEGPSLKLPISGGDDDEDDDDDDDDGQGPSEPGPSRVADLPPELAGRILALAAREPTPQIRQFILAELRAGGNTAWELGTVETMWYVWGATAGGAGAPQNLAEAAPMYTRVEFARLWYPMYLADLDEDEIYDIYAEVSDRYEMLELRNLWGNAAELGGVLSHLRPQPYFAYRPYLGSEYARLEAEVWKFMAAAKIAEEIETKEGQKRFEISPRRVLRNLFDKALTYLGIVAVSPGLDVDGIRDEIAEQLEDLGERKEAGEVTGQEYENEYSDILSLGGEVDLIEQDQAKPIVFVSKRVIRIVRNRPDPRPLRPADYVFLAQLVYVSGRTHALGDEQHVALAYLQDADFVGILIAYLRRRGLRVLLRHYPIKPWWKE